MDLKEECLYRLNLLKEQGLLTDVNVIDLFKDEDTICVSEANRILDMIIGVVMPINQKTIYMKAYNKLLNEYCDVTPYFAMAQNTSFGMMVSFLYVGSNSEYWESEKRDLMNKEPFAYVYNFDEDSLEVGGINFEFFNGGPIRIA